MIAQLRSWWLAVNASYWFYPAIFSLIAAGLAFLTVWLDRTGAAEWISQYEWLSPARPEGARNVLNVIAGSMIGVASTVFSITIAAVAYASGNYGPRLLTNFMEDRGNQLSLGTFIATFVYSVMVLRVVRGEDEQPATAIDAVATITPGFVPQLSLLVATVMMAISVAVLVYFLNHIPASIRINTVLEGIGERLINDIKTRFPESDNGREPKKRHHGDPVITKETGYIDLIDFSTLDDIAKESGAIIDLNVRTGDFVHPDMAIAHIGMVNGDEDLAERIRDCFALGGMRTPTQDLEFLFDEMVEIALRALSPGINDPFTAITAMHWMGAAIAEIGHRDLEYGPEQERYSRNRVRPLDDDYHHYLSRSFGGVRSSAAGDVIAAKQFLDCLYSASSTISSDARREAIISEGDLLIKQARSALTGPALEEIEHRFKNFQSSLSG